MHKEFVCVVVLTYLQIPTIHIYTFSKIWQPTYNTLLESVSLLKKFNLVAKVISTLSKHYLKGLEKHIDMYLNNISKLVNGVPQINVSR